MKLKDIKITDGAGFSGLNCVYFGSILLVVILSMIDTIALYCFNYSITIFEKPL
jgi:hypothetical protein